jgi:hypothetical protein
MRSFFGFFFGALPFTIGIILTLTSLTLLADFADQSIGFHDFLDKQFFGFVFFAFLGIPWLLFGVERLSVWSSRRRRLHER